MTLLKPTSSFTIPSLYDDLELDCRIYYPRHSPTRSPFFGRGFAIIAHPYAPLGGSYDDPVVAVVGATLLHTGMTLGTFNFRGAHESAGRTSWSGKPEVGDYVAFYGFMLCFLNYVWAHINHHDTSQPTLIIGGYSFGSLIASSVPSCQYITDLFQHAQDDSAENEIRSRAEHMAKDFIAFLDMHDQGQIGRGRSTLRVEDATSPPSRGIVVGGYGSEAASRRISRESSRKSFDADRVRQSIDRARQKLRSRDGSQQELAHDQEHHSNDKQQLLQPKTANLLISPLLPPISGFITMFSPPKFEKKITGSRKSWNSDHPTEKNALTSNPTCCIYGERDVFTSHKRLRKWVEEQQTRSRSTFTAYEIQGAGHFWQESGAVSKLQTSLKEWVETLK